MQGLGKHKLKPHTEVLKIYVTGDLLHFHYISNPEVSMSTSTAEYRRNKTDNISTL